MKKAPSSSDRLLLSSVPADVKNLFKEQEVPSFAYFDRQLEQAALRAAGMWPILAQQENGTNLDAGRKS